MMDMERKRKKINHILIYLKKLCEYYSSYSYASPQIKERRRISFEILKIAVFMALDENTLRDMESPMKEIEEILREHFVVFYEKTKTLVQVTGIKSDEDDMDILFPIWALFQYTYRFDEEPKEDRDWFLWWALIVPYFGKAVRFGEKANRKFFKSLKEKFPVQEAVIEMLKAAGYAKERDEIKDTFLELMDKYLEQHNDYHPSKADLEVSADEFGVGFSNANRILKPVRRNR